MINWTMQNANSCSQPLPFANRQSRKLLQIGNQKIKYKKLIKSYILKRFSSRLVDYSHPKKSLESEKKINEKYTIVYSKLIGTSERPEVKIDWRIYTKDPENPLVLDLTIEGVSLARAQKEEFNSIIANNDGKIEALFESLNNFLEN